MTQHDHPDPTSAPSGIAPPTVAAPAGPERSTLDKRWLLRIGFMTLLLFGFAVWGYYDATVAYPKRGRWVAAFDLRELIRVAQAEGALNRVSTPDPKAELARLRAADPKTLGQVDLAKLTWLDSMSRLGPLDPSKTTFADVPGKKQEIDDAIASSGLREQPTRLSAFDIPMQWLIFGVCALLGLWLLALILKVAGTKYAWDPASRTLTMPGGATLTPADIEEFDKRKWHKFLIDLKVRPGHPQLGGKSVRLDLFRHAKLESWVLEMEQAATTPV